MSSFTLCPVTPSDHHRLAEVQHAAFWPEDPLAAAALIDVAEQDHISWIARGFQNPWAPPGCTTECVCAKDGDGKIVAWAKWAIPLNEVVEKRHSNGDDPEKEKIQFWRTLPKGINEEIWTSFFVEIGQHEERIMGGRAHWDLLILVVDPAFQRRGLGKLLLQDGLERAHRAGFPVFLSASPKGVPLYKSLGFEVKSAPELTKAKILATMMVKEKS